ncbi:DJ-1/PfpI family protein [Actinocrispum sp. NPDC049592]|uniref:DJ-1/PfpI family protein n=1 Tax=Actinocrispum sp. NPDC049592 TaxID=3154835 RepID=UPI00344A33CC
MLAQVVLFDGFDPLDVIAPYEVLASGGVEVELVSAEGPRRVPAGSNLLTLEATARLDPSRAGIVIVPGAAGDVENEIPMLLAATLGTPLPGLLKEALDRDGVTVATVCGGSLVLAMAGLIKGRPATTHHLGLDPLAATGVLVVDARVVDDGDLVTASSVTSGLDLGLYLLEREVSPRVAHDVETLFRHERRGVVWR